MIFLRCVHMHLGNIVYKYGWNHNLENKVICIYMTGGVYKFSEWNSSNQNITLQ